MCFMSSTVPCYSYMLKFVICEVCVNINLGIPTNSGFCQRPATQANQIPQDFDSRALKALKPEMLHVCSFGYGTFDTRPCGLNASAKLWRLDEMMDAKRLHNDLLCTA